MPQTKQAPLAVPDGQRIARRLEEEAAKAVRPLRRYALGISIRVIHDPELGISGTVTAVKTGAPPPADMDVEVIEDDGEA